MFVADRANKFCFALMALIAVFGCSTARFYNGPERPRSELALIKVDISHEWIEDTDDSVRIVGINGSKTRTKSAWVEPGTCAIQLEFENSYEGREYFSRAPTTISFNAEAGKTYTVGHSYDYLEGTWSAWLVDGFEQKTKNTVVPHKASDVITKPFTVKREANEHDSITPPRGVFK